MSGTAAAQESLRQPLRRVTSIKVKLGLLVAASVLVAAVLGVGVHVLTSLGGLVEDNRTGRRHLPLRLALRVGAPRLLVLAIAFCAVAAGGAALVGSTVGLSQ